MIQASDDKPSGSYTAAGKHTTAAAVGKTYAEQFGASENPDKRPARPDDGHVTSAGYAASSETLADTVTPEAVRIDFSHPLEWWAARRPFRWLLRRLSRRGRDGTTALERILESYRNPAAPRGDRIRYWLLHRFIDRMRGDVDAATFRQRLADNRPTVRGLVVVARSLGLFGPMVPQRFVAPLFAVWNFTNRCNLRCRHCYQDSDHAALPNELSLAEKLDLVEQMADAYLPMLALSGGEPTVSPHLLSVVKRAAGYGMHVTLATNGTTMTPRRAGELADAGLRYVEISLDSVDAKRHDAFRGVPGMWEKAVAGARAVVETPGLRLGIAMCVHRGNLGEVREMIEFAERLGAGCFAHFNFIPVGRGLRMVSGDITPRQREELLALLNAKMQEGGIGVISTAPQLGRVCLAGAALDGGRVTCSHAGSGSGVKARVVAKYLGGCGAGRTYACVEPDGNVTPCVYLPHRVMGNVRDKPFARIFRESVFWDVLNDRSARLHHCEVCAFRNYCGGCRARADAYFGQLHAGDPGCIFNEKHWDALVAAGIAQVEPTNSTNRTEGEDHDGPSLDGGGPVPADPPEGLVVTPTRHGPG